jgi:hypothetical protein
MAALLAGGVSLELRHFLSQGFMWCQSSDERVEVEYPVQTDLIVRLFNTLITAFSC